MGTTYYFLPTRNLFGEDSVKETGSLMQSLGGKKTLIVTDAFLAKQGMARMVQDILKDSGVESVVFGGSCRWHIRQGESTAFHVAGQIPSFRSGAGWSSGTSR